MVRTSLILSSFAFQNINSPSYLIPLPPLLPSFSPSLHLPSPHETGTINRSTFGPHPPLYSSNSITFPAPLFNGTVSTLVPGVVSPPVGRNATTCPIPFTITLAKRCVASPLVWWMRIVVAVVAMLLEMVEKVRVPEEVPPMYPTGGVC